MPRCRRSPGGSSCTNGTTPAIRCVWLERFIKCTTATRTCNESGDCSTIWRSVRSKARMARASRRNLQRNEQGLGATKMAGLNDVLETTQFEKLADGFVFTEGPLWHPDGFYYFVDVRTSMLYRIVPGQPHTLVRQTTGGNGLTFDMQGRLINCEG